MAGVMGAVMAEALSVVGMEVAGLWEPTFAPSIGQTSN